MKQVSDLKESVGAILTGIDLDTVPDLYGDFERAVSTMIQKADILEASGREPIMLYDGVTDYEAPDAIFGGSIIDLRPQGVQRQTWDTVSKMPIERFDRTKWWNAPSGYRVTFETRVKKLIMRVSQNFAKQKVSIDGMTDTDDWTIGGNGSGLAEDSTVFYHQPASLRFNLAVAGSSSSLSKTLESELDLSEYEGVGVVFLAAYIPDPDAITSIKLRIGSSAANYVEITATEGFLGEFYANDFQLVAFDTAGATEVGTVDWSAIDYVDIITEYDGTAVNNMRYGDLFISLPSSNEVLFYSPNVFLPTDSNTPAAEISTDSDEILFRNAAYNIYVQEAAREVAKNEGGDVSSGLIQSIDQVLEGNGSTKIGLYQAFRGDNPSEEVRQVGNWYYD